MYERRASGEHAGRMCPFKSGTHMCTNYARYAVSPINYETGELQDVILACGPHVAEGIREGWKKAVKCVGAVVVQEIPGMWR